MAAIPDAKLLESLRRSQGEGRDDCPVQVLWDVPPLNHCLASSDSGSLSGRTAA